MTTIEKSVVINVPLKKVFDFAADMSNLKKYFVYVNEVESLGQAILKKDAKYSLKVKFLGGIRDSEWECIEYDKSGWKIDATLLGVTARKQWKFNRINSYTKVTFTLDYEPAPPVFGKLLDVLIIKRSWVKLYEESFNKLKSIIELY